MDHAAGSHRVPPMRKEFAMSVSSSQAPVTPFSTDLMPQSSRESSPFAQAVQRVENCLAAMQKINEQIAGLAEQRRKVQDELRGIQCQMNEEFDRILKPARAPSAAPGKVVEIGRAHV